MSSHPYTQPHPYPHSEGPNHAMAAHRHHGHSHQPYANTSPPGHAQAHNHPSSGHRQAPPPPPHHHQQQQQQQQHPHHHFHRQQYLQHSQYNTHPSQHHVTHSHHHQQQQQHSPTAPVTQPATASQAPRYIVIDTQGQRVDSSIIGLHPTPTAAVTAQLAVPRSVPTVIAHATHPQPTQVLITYQYADNTSMAAAAMPTATASTSTSATPTTVLVQQPHHKQVLHLALPPGAVQGNSIALAHVPTPQPQVSTTGAAGSGATVIAGPYRHPPPHAHSQRLPARPHYGDRVATSAEPSHDVVRGQAAGMSAYNTATNSRPPTHDAPPPHPPPSSASTAANHATAHPRAPFLRPAPVLSSSYQYRGRPAPAMTPMQRLRLASAPRRRNLPPIRNVKEHLKAVVAELFGDESSKSEQGPPAKEDDKGKPYIEKVGKLDILCGRGGKINNHPGNRYFRSIVRELRMSYKRIDSKLDKTGLSKAIVDSIRKRGGRFVRTDEFTGRHYILSLDDARRKTSQALRESNCAKYY